ncbi:MAG: helix-turn-helix domain-containing protein [Butyrivibrio sp.]|jgi:transcriptional regulator with XRE-family HTH domain|nr:helix-turn-helix domain-containing protein [Butyrivibrio sp.]
MIDDKKIGLNVKTFRSVFNETQKDLAKLLGFTNKAISLFEKGERRMDIDVLAKIAEHYMITVDELISSDYSNSEKIDIDKIETREKVPINNSL